MRRENIKKRRRKKRKRILSVVLIVGLLLIIIPTAFVISKNILEKNISKNQDNTPKEDTTQNEKPVEPVKQDVKEEVLISAAGDSTLGTDTKFSGETLPAVFNTTGKNYAYFYQNVYDIFSKDDYTFVNLETTFTDATAKKDKGKPPYYHFKGPKDYVNILTSGSIEGVTVANNHIYDYGQQGFNDTIEVLKGAKVDIAGEGYKIVKEIKGIKFGFLGYQAWSDTKELRDKIKSDIAELKNSGCEVVIPYFHWGIEGQYKPYDVQVNIGKYAIDSGADLVLGSHPHVVQTLENYKGKLIVYSFGNFCFGGNNNPTDKRTFILQAKLNFTNGKLEQTSFKVIPCSVSSVNNKNDYRPTPMKDQNKTNLLKFLNELSPTLNGEIKDEFFQIQ